MSELENIVLDPTVPNLASESVQNLIPPKKKFPFLLYISLILLSVVSVISIYLFLQVRQLTLEKLTPSPTPSPSPSADPTAGWETYSNAKLGLSFKMPKDYKVSEKVPGYLKVSTIEDIDRAQVGISIETRMQKPYDDYSDAVTYFYRTFTQSNTESVTDQTDDSKDHQVTWTLFDGVGKLGQLEGVSFKIAYKQYKQGVITVETIANSNYSKVLTDLISTFKFTDNLASELPKKYFVPSGKFFDTRPYPTELTSLKDTDLTGFSCSDKYTKRENNEYVFRKYGSGEGAGYEDTNLTDKPVLEYLQANGADEAVVCKTDTGRTLLSYGIFGKGGGVGSATYYGYLEGNNPSVATIPTENGPYFTCGTILAITKSNTLYVECLSGDGGFGSKSLYRVGLYKAYTSDLLLKCTTTMQDESSTPKITCGTTQ